jgi:OmpA-OmpF porin, OOP family
VLNVVGLPFVAPRTRFEARARVQLHFDYCNQLRSLAPHCPPATHCFGERQHYAERGMDFADTDSDENGSTTDKEDVMRTQQGTVLAIASATLALCAMPVLGQERDRIDENDNRGGLYLGGAIGDFSANLAGVEDVDDVDLDFDDEDATRVYAGWRFNPYLAVQLDYTDFGTGDASTNLLGITTETDGWTPSIVGTLPLGPVELYAKAGMIFYNVDVDLDAVNNSLDETFSDSGEDAVFGVGIGVTVLEHLNLRAEYERIDIEEFDDADAVWLSANWRF